MALRINPGPGTSSPRKRFTLRRPRMTSARLSGVTGLSFHSDRSTMWSLILIGLCNGFVAVSGNAGENTVGDRPLHLLGQCLALIRLCQPLRFSHTEIACFGQ